MTGASGLIGSALCAALTGRGDEVVGLTRSVVEASAKRPSVRWHRWDYRQGPPPAAALEGIDAIVNLQGETLNQRWSDEAKERIVSSRRDATQMLAQTVARLAKRPSVVVSGSAVGYYGDRGDARLDEEAGPGPAGFDTEVVASWEAAAEGFANVGIRLVKLRTGHVLAPSGGLLGRLLAPFKLGLGGPMAGGRQYMSWIHIEDEIGIILWALDTDAVTGPVNATSPNPATNAELTKALGRALRRPAILPLPGFALDIILGSELGATVKGGQRVLPAKAQSLGYRFRHPNLDEALSDLF